MSAGPHKPVSILFVCTGNICRSPLAEYLLRDYAARQGKGGLISVSSAGTHAWEGNAATGEARAAGRKWGLDLAGHRAREARRSIVESSDIILAMTRAHHEWLVRAFPERKNAIYLALLFPRRLDEKSPAAADVPDPIGESVGFYLDVLEMLKPALPVILSAALGKETF
ncbi:MAG: low molecular weight phosphotyrosine protein phosphatase [Actinobacteria bacterium]|nr:low molecular weight phosphotyrosine protein phosphatase [Actinomycetota bacterium]